MNTLFVVIIGAVVIWTAYNLYARRIDREIIQVNDKRATPAKMYMDGVDFMPANRNVLYGYHFKSIAAAGPIVGVITAANLWGWLPAILWLMIGVSFIGWASDYSAIMLSVRNDGNSLSAVAHKLIAPRTRTVMFVFIFFYLLLIAGAFIGILAAILAARPAVPFGIVILTLIGIVLGPLGQTRDAKNALVQGPVGQAMVGINTTVNSLSGGTALYTVVDPTNAYPRIPAPGPDGKRASTAVYNA